jgi:AraC-like DNA-binding protein
VLAARGADLGREESRCDDKRKRKPSWQWRVGLMALLWTRKKAAEELGMSLSHFQRHVQPYLPCVYSGRLRMYRPEDVEQGVDEMLTEPVGRRRTHDEAPSR